MDWLNLTPDLSNQFEIERVARQIMTITNLQQLQTLAADLYRLAVQQSHVAQQAVHQVADLEAAAGFQVRQEHEEWAAEILAQRASS